MYRFLGTPHDRAIEVRLDEKYYLIDHVISSIRLIQWNLRVLLHITWILRKNISFYYIVQWSS